MPDFCEAFTCLRPTEPLTSSNSMKVHAVLEDVDSTGFARRVPQLDTTLTIHRACFNSRQYIAAN